MVFDRKTISIPVESINSSVFSPKCLIIVKWTIFPKEIKLCLDALCKVYLFSFTGKKSHRQTTRLRAKIEKKVIMTMMTLNYISYVGFVICLHQWPLISVLRHI